MMQRLIIVTASLVLTALLAAWLDLPRRSSASSASEAVIVRLSGRDHDITVTTGAAGPTYSVSRNGRIVADRLSLDSLRTADPASYQQIRSATADHSPTAWAGIED
jgi:hypothetical protein